MSAHGVIGIANSRSGFNDRLRPLPELVETIGRGVRAAAGVRTAERGCDFDLLGVPNGAAP